ncbi:MAG TPA: dihydrofolate reductase family protein [Actinomycetota bacterium]|nr:dihydrofolate reductase family protein [Actinomycetota bacterium]
MGKLRYTAITSLDGYTADAQGSFEWAAPDEAVHSFVNDLERDIGTYLYGRRMYEVMQYWETAPTDDGQPPYLADYARIWQATDKIVYSTTLDNVSTARTKLEPSFDPDTVRAMKEENERELSIGGPGLAASALRAGLVDHIGRIVVPAVVGGGTAFLPDGLRLDLELLDEHGFPDGAVYLAYRVKQ